VAADDPRDGHSADWRRVPETLTIEQLRRELSALREILTARLDGMDTATKLLSETVNRTPTEIQKQIAHLKELLEFRLDAGEKIALTRLAGIEQQFAERDIRTDQAGTAAGEALKAALQAAKEAVFEQAQAADKAAAKTEQSFTEQIKQSGLRIDTVAQGLGARVDEIKERLDRGEGAGQGHAATVTDTRADAALAQARESARDARRQAMIASAIAILAFLGFVIEAIVQHAGK
jgi:hypothetical protein